MRDKNIKIVHLKGNNSRVTVMLKYNEEHNCHYYLILTKKLTDFKTRQINKTENIFSLATFHALMQVGFVEFTNDSLLQNKVLLREISKIKQFKASRYLDPELLNPSNK